MILIKRFFLILACLAFGLRPVLAQDVGGSDEESALEEIVLSDEMRQILAAKIEGFTMSIDNLLESVAGTQEPQLKAIRRYASALDMKWSNFYDTNLDLIAADDSLLEAASVFQETRQKTTDAIEAREKTLKQLVDFVSAERFISQHVKQHEKLYKDAFTYSLIEKMTPQLEELKAKDQLLMGELSQHYEVAHQAALDNKVLKARWEKLDKHFISIKGYSQQIQQLEYKPLLQRVKDYIMSLAAVAIIILFFSFIVIRLKAAQAMKKAAEEAKKQREQLNANIPTI